MSQPNVHFYADSSEVAKNREHAERIGSAMGKYLDARDVSQSAFRDWQGARQAASDIKSYALDNLADLLEAFEKNITVRGAKVHWAKDAESANALILEILQKEHVKNVLKAKTMTAEEIHLNEHLQTHGISVVETDLGEFVQQLRKEPPYHFVFPCMHLKRDEIADLFRKELHVETEDSPEALTLVARNVLRDKFLDADAGITGANFLIADPGLVALTENEGNIRLTAALPRVMITLVGIEKVVARVEDLALLWPMLATAGTGQSLTGYNTLYAGPRQAGEPDGPEVWHIVLLDNGRSKLLADPELRESLKCIRCGACLNVCPVYRHIGGLSYGATYQGPIGAVITPTLRGIAPWAHLSHASSLCGACTETCPVQINLHEMLTVNRHHAVQNSTSNREQRIAWLVSRILSTPALYRISTRLTRLFLRLGIKPPPLRAWEQAHSTPLFAKQTFRERRKP